MDGPTVAVSRCRTRFFVASRCGRTTLELAPAGSACAARPPNPGITRPVIGRWVAHARICRQHFVAHHPNLPKSVDNISSRL